MGPEKIPYFRTWMSLVCGLDPNKPENIVGLNALYRCLTDFFQNILKGQQNEKI